jgi:hypothetical protein
MSGKFPAAGKIVRKQVVDDLARDLGNELGKR